MQTAHYLKRAVAGRRFACQPFRYAPLRRRKKSDQIRFRQPAEAGQSHQFHRNRSHLICGKLTLGIRRAVDMNAASVRRLWFDSLPPLTHNAKASPPETRARGAFRVSTEAQKEAKR